MYLFQEKLLLKNTHQRMKVHWFRSAQSFNGTIMFLKPTSGPLHTKLILLACFDKSLAILCRHMLVCFICVEEHNTHTQQIAVFERMTLKYYLHTPTSRNQQGLSHTKFWKKDYHAPNFGSREGESKPLEFTVSCNCQFWRSAYVNCTGQNYKLISRSIFPQTS